MKRYSPLAAAAFALFLTTTLIAAPPPERVLPSNTRAFFASPDVAQLETAWQGTNFAKLAGLPSMQPFMADLQQAQRMPWDQILSELGLTMADVRGVAAGEACGAIVPTAKNLPGSVLLVDTASKQPQVQALLGRIATAMRARGVTGANQPIPGTSVTATAYSLPATATTPASQRCFALCGDLFVAADDLAVLSTVAQRSNGAASDVLASLPAFQSVEARWKTAAGPAEFQLRWFVDPVGMASLIDAAAPPPAPTKASLKSKSKSKAKPKPADKASQFLAKHGFDAVRGLGGSVTFANNEHDLFARIAVVAPQPYSNAMQMFGFLPSNQFTPQPWVPATVGKYATFHLNMRQSFDSFSSLFDEWFGEGETGVFDDVIDSIKTDPNGPGVDLRAELIDRLNPRGTLLGDSLDPVGPRSERSLLAAETKDPAAVAAALGRLMQGDPGIARREVNGHTIWETQNLVSDPEQRVPKVAITVAHGHLLVSTHVELLEQVINGAALPKLADDPVFQQITAALDGLAGKDSGLRMVARTADDLRMSYELMRVGQLQESESMYGQLYRVLQKSTAVAAQKQPNGKLLPDYSQVRDYLKPAAAVGTIHNDGWLLTGFVLKQ